MSEEGFDHPHEEMLFESKRGFVRYCRVCGAFELRFGNAILGLRNDDLRLITETVQLFDEEYRTGLRPDSAPSTIWLGHEGSGFRFRREEIAELHRLLAGAALFAQLHPSASEPDSAF